MDEAVWWAFDLFFGTRSPVAGRRQRVRAAANRAEPCVEGLATFAKARERRFNDPNRLAAEAVG